MRVYVVIYNLSIGGIFTFAQNLVSNLRKRHKIDASIYVYIPESVALNKALVQKSGIPVDTAYNNKIPILLFNLYYRIAQILFPKYDARSSTLNFFLKRKIKKKKINILHSNYQRCDSVCLEIAEKLNTKVVITDHGSYRMTSLPKNRLDLMQKVASQANALIALTDKTEENFSKHNIKISDKLIFKKIYNGIDLSRLPNASFQIDRLNPDDFIFGMLARGTKEKGWEIAIEAFELLKSKKPNKNIKLVLTGESEYLQQLSNHFKNNTDIIFTGPTSKPLDIIQHYHVALFPSYLNVESMPFSIIEYLQCGKPVLASCIGSIEEMLSTDDQLAGDVISLDQLNPENLSRLMDLYLKDNSLVANKSELSLKAVKKFDLNTISKNYLDMYNLISQSKN
ncbi:MAG: glycosyltransferase family 4 protein [Reichenbachiella sp.]|uniref:glycosyltransferase family 4 protein n=1 Tax=Reichenbachiella sp. TaxID=2184521 RepID=UPI00329A4470